MSTSPDLFARPLWIERLPARADALCVAGEIERHVPVHAWGAAIGQAQDAGFEVDAAYLRDRRTIIRMHVARMARSTDPDTSHLAAERIVASGARADHVGRIVAAVHRHPGKTSAELAQITGLERHEAARRTSDAEHDGLIRKGLPRTCTISGKSAVTWFPPLTDSQVDCLRGAA